MRSAFHHIAHYLLLFDDPHRVWLGVSKGPHRCRAFSGTCAVGDLVIPAQSKKRQYACNGKMDRVRRACFYRKRYVYGCSKNATDQIQRCF